MADNTHMNPEQVIVDNPAPAIEQQQQQSQDAEVTAAPNTEQVVESDSTPAGENHGPPEGHPRWDEVISQKNDEKRRREEAEASSARLAEELARMRAAQPANTPASPAPAEASTGPFDAETAKALDSFLTSHPAFQQLSQQAAAQNIRQQHPELSDPDTERQFYEQYERMQQEQFQGDATAALILESLGKQAQAAQVQQVSGQVDARMEQNEQIKAQSLTPQGGGTPPPQPTEDPLQTWEQIKAHSDRVMSKARSEGIL